MAETTELRELRKALRKKLGNATFPRPVRPIVVIAPTLERYLQWCVDQGLPPRNQVWAHEIQHLYGRALKDAVVLGYPEGEKGEEMRLFVHAMTKPV